MKIKPNRYYTASDYIIPALFTTSMIAGVAFLITLTNYMQKRGDMLGKELRLKYDDKGNPRPEYWQGQLLTDQQERIDSHVQR